MRRAVGVVVSVMAAPVVFGAFYKWIARHLLVDPPQWWLDCQADPARACTAPHNDLPILAGNAVLLVIIAFASIRSWRWSQGYRWWPRWPSASDSQC